MVEAVLASGVVQVVDHPIGVGREWRDPAANVQRLGEHGLTPAGAVLLGMFDLPSVSWNELNGSAAFGCFGDADVVALATTGPEMVPMVWAFV